MGSIQSKIKAREISCAVKVIRANGAVEDYGVVAYRHKNPLKTLAWSFRKWLQSFRRS